MAVTVKDILRKKGSEVVTVQQNMLAYDALQLMLNKKIGALIVTDATGRVVGIVSERDYTRKIVLEERPARTTPVAEIMTRALYGATPGKTAEECISLMLQEHIRHLPVFDEEEMVGLISIGDTVKSIVKGQWFEINHLRKYIINSANSV